MFWVLSLHNLYHAKTTQRTKTTLGGPEGELLSEYQTRAMAVHMNGIRETPPQFLCQWLPMTTETQGEPLTHHVTQRAGCPQDCNLNDLSHIPLDWALWGPYNCKTVTNLYYSVQLNSVLKIVTADVIASGQGWLDWLQESFEGLENTESERWRKGLRGLVFLLR